MRERRGGKARAACSTVWPFALVAVLGGCEKAPPDPLENTTPSPNASILPAPLSPAGQPAAELPGPAPNAPHTGAPADSSGRTGGDGGVVLPEPFRSDERPLDDALSVREFVGASLMGEWKFADLPTPTRAPEFNGPGWEALRKMTLGRMSIDLLALGRMRIAFASRALPLPSGSEIRSRIDRYGHLLVWPSGQQFRVLLPGAVRTLFAERRVDAIPLVRPQTTGRTEGPKRLGYPTHKWELSTRAGKLTLEQAKIAGIGEAGPLLCRFLSEIIAIDPSAAPCATDEVPLRAQYAWPQGGSVTFEITQVNSRTELTLNQFAVPPASTEFTPSVLPPSTGDSFLSREELGTFRVRPVDLPPQPASPAHPLSSPSEGLVLFNGTESLRYLFIDAVPVAWVSPYREKHILGLPRGHYVAQWRTFLGDAIEPATSVDVPGRLTLGSLDAGHER